MQPFKANAAMVNFCSIEDSAEFYDQVMGLWQTYVKLLPLNYHVLKYESLVSDFQGELEKLLTFLGLGWDARMLDYAEHAKTRGQISTPSFHQVIRPVYQSSRYRWQRYRERLAPVMGILKPYLDAF
jgi:hypothetical protein